MPKIRKIAVFPGTFDPPTLGHLDVIRRGHKLFDHLIVAVGRNPDKSELFPVPQRLELIRTLVADLPTVSVESYEGLTVELVRQRGAVAILRGLRNMTDLQYEVQLALTNRAVADVDTVFIMTNERFAFTSSSLIRQIAALGGNLDNLSSLLPSSVIEHLREYRDKQVGPFRTPQSDIPI
ncbi:MAG: pantetheine-phosphate adenylyltransferase [Phycisphaerae bacterium]